MNSEEAGAAGGCGGGSGGRGRLSTGVAALDERLGGGLLPGALTVVVGAAGAGKTQLGVQFAAAGVGQEGAPGVFFDMSARGDSQSHADYARRIAGWELRPPRGSWSGDAAAYYDQLDRLGDYLHVFDHSGRRVTRRSLDADQWHAWQGELNARLGEAIAFLYGAFARGAQRVVVDGVEPAADPADSVQITLFDYLYHQVVRKEHDWVARDLFRERFRGAAELVARHAYDHRRLGCLLLCTSRETMLDELVERGLDEGDELTNANTVIYMGRLRDGASLARGLVIAKHRGSACSDEVIRYRITDAGLCILS